MLVRRAVGYAVALALAFCTVVFAAAAVLAQAAYPSRPVKVIVPYPPGGSFDGVPRVVLQDIAAQHGWTTVIENRPGADGLLGIGAARRSEPDGYNLVAITSITHGSSPALKLNLGYDPHKDLIPIILLGDAGMMLQVKKDLAAATVGDLITLIKAKPGVLNFGSGGGTSQHFFAAMMFFQRAGLKPDSAVHVPFPGIAAGLQALLQGTVDFMFASTGPSAPHIETGAIRALALAADTRLAKLPNVPTMIEVGYPGFKSVAWVGLAAPAGTPSAIIEQWNSHANAALRNPAVRKRVLDFDFEPRGGTPSEFAAYSAAEIEKHIQLVDALGLQRR